jgi:hypothetical protein
MHPVGQSWVSGHPDYAEGNRAQCQACHGADSRGTVLSRAQGTRTLTAGFEGGTATLNLFRGAMIGCYNCHNGPGSDSINNGAPPTVSVVSGNTLNSAALNMTVTVTPPTATLRILSQPGNGSLGVRNNILTYFPNEGFSGADTFTYAAWDGSKNSSLATGTVAVAPGPFSLGATAHVPPTYPAGWPVAFAVVPVMTNTLIPASFNWDFGDGSTPSTNQFSAHEYATPGSYNWSVVANVSGATATRNGTIIVGNPVSLGMSFAGDAATFSWPKTLADTLLEATGALGPSAQWMWVTNSPTASASLLSVTLPVSGSEFFRVRRPW